MRTLTLVVLGFAAVPALLPARPAAAAEDAAAQQRRAEAQKHFQAGESAMRSDAFEEAEREYARAAELDPAMVWAHYGLGQARMALKRYPGATAAFVACRDALRREASLSGHEQDDLARHRRHQIEELKEAIRTARQAGGSRSEPIVVVQLEERLRVLESAARRPPERIGEAPAPLSLALGSSYLRQGLLPDAEREYRAALQADPKLGAAHNNLAVVCMLLQRFDEAEQAVRQAEKAGFKVSPQLKADIERRRAEAANPAPAAPKP